MDKKDKKKQLKMQKAVGKTVNAAAFVDLKPAKVNYFRPPGTKVSVAPKDSLSDKEFKDMKELHGNAIDAVHKTHKLRLAKAAKEAEESKKLEAERKQNVKPKFFTLENLTSTEMRPAFAAMKVAILATKVK